MPAPRVTERLIRGYIEKGRGLGFGESYQPFIQLKRWNASPVSTQTIGRLPPFGRDAHFLSRSEWLLALLLSWAGCHVREQLPMWPWSHPHPLDGNPGREVAALPWSSGTIELCRCAGIRHGVFVGTKLPYIWTLDLVANLAWRVPPALSCVILSVKPLNSEQYTGDIDPIARGPEKLEIERRYAAELGIKYIVGDRTRFPGALLGQLEWLSGAAVVAADSDVARGVQELLTCRGDTLPQLPPTDWHQMLVRDHRLRPEQADVAIQHILWHQHVDTDLSRQWQPEDCVRPGGRKLREAIRRYLSEVDA